MNPEMNIELNALTRLSVKQLQQKYAEVFGDSTNGRNKAWLVKRIAWRLQAIAHGGLSDRAKQQALEMANEADLRLSPPKSRPLSGAPTIRVEKDISMMLDDRLPPPGTIITRKYKGVLLQVRVRPKGFEYEGVVYASLSALAKQITGSHTNGYTFFKLDRPGAGA